MERIGFILSLFNYIPPSTPNILDMILEELRKPHQVLAGKGHPLTLISLLYYLTLFKKYEENQIHELMNEEALLKKYGKSLCKPFVIITYWATYSKSTLNLVYLAPFHLKLQFIPDGSN